MEETQRLLGLADKTDPQIRKTADSLLTGILTIVLRLYEQGRAIDTLGQATLPPSSNHLKKTAKGDDQWLTTEQTCKTLAIGRTHLHKMKVAGLFPSTRRVGKSDLFSRQDIEQVREMDPKERTRALRQARGRSTN